MESEVHISSRAGGTPTRAIPWRLILALLCLSLIFGAVAASHESLWIDEGFSAFFANQPDFAHYISSMKQKMGSDAQAPLYTAYLWAWRQGFGASEDTLRLANLPWILLGHAALLIAMARAGMRRATLAWFTLAAAVSPFLTFYINQARCYGMQYGTACMTLAYLIAIAASPREEFRLPVLGMGLLGAVLLCATSRACPGRGRPGWRRFGFSGKTGRALSAPLRRLGEQWRSALSCWGYWDITIWEPFCVEPGQPPGTPAWARFFSAPTRCSAWRGWAPDATTCANWACRRR